MSANHTVLLRGEDSGGVLSMTEMTVPAGWEGPPLHHHEFDEGVYVLDGELTVQLGDELVSAIAGQYVFARGGVHHTLANLSGSEARYLMVCTPAGFERHVARGAPENAWTAVGPRIGERADLGPAGALETAPARVRVLVRGPDSEGRIAVMDNTVPSDFTGPPLHHHEFDETFYVIHGELTFQLGDELVTRRAGELAFAPGGAHHTYTNRSGAEARILLICTPAGFERFFQQIAAREAGVEPPPEALEPWPEVTVVGPRLGSS